MLSSKIIALVNVAALLVASGIAQADNLVRNVRIVDVEAGTAGELQDILIGNGVIISLTSAGGPAPDGVAVFDAGGGYAIPGLWDSHVHIFSSSDEYKTVIHAQERGAPKGRKGIDWKLITDLPVGLNKDAIEKLNWYAMRWKIEVFHKILKSGRKAEHSKLGTRATPGEFDRGLLHPELAGVLDDDDEPGNAERIPQTGADRHGNHSPRQSCERSPQKPSGNQDATPLPHQNRQARGLSCPRQRSTTRQYGHVERPVTSHGHRIGRNHGSQICG